MISLWKYLSLLWAVDLIICRYSDELARGKPTLQIGTKSYWSSGHHLAGNSSFAVDGKPVVGPNQTCSHTPKYFAPWWMVDLEDIQLIKEVTITPRLSSCVISNFTISVSRFWDVSWNQMVNPSLCYTSTSDLPGGIQTVLPCVSQLIGRYIDIRKFTSQIRSLCICEVEVYGSRNDRFCSFKSRPGKRSQSLRLHTLQTPSRVICAGYCHENLECTSFNFEQKNKTCELIADSLVDMNDQETTDYGWTRYTFQ